jgi:hypothetical protein
MKQLGGADGSRALLWRQGESDAHQLAGHEMGAAEYRRMIGLSRDPDMFAQRKLSY